LVRFLGLKRKLETFIKTFSTSVTTIAHASASSAITNALLLPQKSLKQAVELYVAILRSFDQ
jgi:hypothetical protein